MVLAALHEAAVFLEVALTEDTPCSFIEIQPEDSLSSSRELSPFISTCMSSLT
jgi:hypothetical protein